VRRDFVDSGDFQRVLGKGPCVIPGFGFPRHPATFDLCHCSSYFVTDSCEAIEATGAGRIARNGRIDVWGPIAGRVHQTLGAVSFSLFFFGFW